MAALADLLFLPVESRDQHERLLDAFAALLSCMDDRPSRSLAHETAYHIDLATNLATLGEVFAACGEPEAALKWTEFSEPDRADSHAQRLLSFTRDPTTANVAKLLAQSASDPAFFDRMRRFVQEFARRMLGPINVQAVCHYARSLREALRPARTESTLRVQNYNALIWLKLLWEELGLDADRPNPSFRGEPEVRRALTDLADLARELSAVWGVQHSVMQPVGNPLEIPRPDDNLLRDLADVVDRLRAAELAKGPRTDGEDRPAMPPAPLSVLAEGQEEKPPRVPPSVPTQGQTRTKQPLPDAFAVYRYWIGTGKTQTNLAEDPALMKMLNRKVSQGTVSRWLKQVKEWLEAGNVLPNLPDSLNSKPTAMDPARIDLGANLEHRPKHQRKPRTSDSDE
jgi:hypothetical protein